MEWAIEELRRSHYCSSAHEIGEAMCLSVIDRASCHKDLLGPALRGIRSQQWILASYVTYSFESQVQQHNLERKSFAVLRRPATGKDDNHTACFRRNSRAQYS